MWSCLQRMCERKIRAPESTYKRHHDRDYFSVFQNIAKSHNLPLLMLQGTSDFEKEYLKLTKFIDGWIERL